MFLSIRIKRKIQKFIRSFKEEEGEINMVAIVLIILVVIALIAIFKEQLTNLLQSLFKKIEEEALKI